MLTEFLTGSIHFMVNRWTSVIQFHCHDRTFKFSTQFTQVESPILKPLIETIYRQWKQRPHLEASNVICVCTDIAAAPGLVNFKFCVDEVFGKTPA